MSWVRVLVVGLVVGACGPKPQKRCASSSAGFCVSGEVCDFDEKSGCQVCTCDPWDSADTGQQGRNVDTGPTAPNAPGPPIPVH